MAEGRQGLVFDLLFFLPVARFVGGAVRILKTAGKLGFKPALPRLGRLTRTLLVALAQELNPADGLSQLLKWGRIKVLMGGRSLASRGWSTSSKPPGAQVWPAMTLAAGW